MLNLFGMNMGILEMLIIPDAFGNDYGEYGSEFSDTSPFNSNSNHPPVIVDRDGNFYGYFTINEYKDKRADFRLRSLLSMKTLN